MMATPWILIAATVAALASLFNVLITTRSNDKRAQTDREANRHLAMLTAKSKLADLKIDWAEKLSENVVSLESLAKQMRETSLHELDDDVKLAADQAARAIELMLDKKNNDHRKLSGAIGDLKSYSLLYYSRSDFAEEMKQYEKWMEKNRHVATLAAELIQDARSDATQLILGES